MLGSHWHGNDLLLSRAFNFYTCFPIHLMDTPQDILLNLAGQRIIYTHFTDEPIVNWIISIIITIFSFLHALNNLQSRFVFFKQSLSLCLFWGEGSIVALQHSIIFYYTAKWISYVYTYIPSSWISFPLRSPQSLESRSQCYIVSSH